MLTAGPGHPLVETMIMAESLVSPTKLAGELPLSPQGHRTFDGGQLPSVANHRVPVK